VTGQTKTYGQQQQSAHVHFQHIYLKISYCLSAWIK